jgi:NADH:ubiquinone oxidoreductase subunit 4 (subunit M)
LIAYSSIVHINSIVARLITKTNTSVFGAITIIISHGLTSPGIFALANYNYQKIKTRNLLINLGVNKNQPSINLF